MKRSQKLIRLFILFFVMMYWVLIYFNPSSASSPKESSINIISPTPTITKPAEVLYERKEMVSEEI